MKGSVQETIDAKNAVHKLPKWAQSFVARISRERDDAVQKLREFQDAQAKSPVWYEETVFENGAWIQVRRYVQTDAVTVEFAGVRATLLCREGATAAGDAIDVQYDTPRRAAGDCILQPRSWQQFYLWRAEG